MLDISKLINNEQSFGSTIRYDKGVKQCLTGVKEGFGPVVVWNCTRTCNLNCVHCYSNSENKKYEHELTTLEAKKMLEDLAGFHVPALLFSGGEPLVRPDFFELAEYAASLGIRPTISTNGTLITKENAKRLKEIGVGYVGISLDGLESVHDSFRRKTGAYQKALEGIRNCVEVGQKVGLRFTITRSNYEQIPAILDLLEKENINRVCFYHLVYSGRAVEMMKDDVSHEESRAFMDMLIDKVIYFGQTNQHKEILTVDNHADAAYLYLYLKKHMPEKADAVLAKLKTNGGNRSAMAFGNIDSLGNVHPDQFTQHHTLGNVLERPFSEIWQDFSVPLLAEMRDRKPLLKGRCTKCKWLDICNGNFRARGEATGDFWNSDPACYLTDDEISE